MNGRWGKAGVRLTGQQRAESGRKALQARLHREAEDAEGYRLWREGRLVPDNLTTALDRNGLHGPDVDRACLAEEPDVDRWEAAELYPTWAQTQALATLCGVTVRLLCHQPGPDVEPMLCGPRVCTRVQPRERLLRYPLDVVARTVDAEEVKP